MVYWIHGTVAVFYKVSFTFHFKKKKKRKKDQKGVIASREIARKEAPRRARARLWCARSGNES
jgi:hypothetical protein